MSRASIISIVIVVLVLAGVIVLAGKNTEVPLTRVEKPVTLGNAAGNAPAQ